MRRFLVLTLIFATHFGAVFGDQLCVDAANELDNIVCGDDELLRLDARSHELEGVWKNGLNSQRAKLLDDVFSQFESQKENCLANSEIRFCVKTAYEDYLHELSRLRAYRTQEKIEGVEYTKDIALRPHSYDELYVDTRLKNLAYFEEIDQNLLDQTRIPLPDGCDLCTRESSTTLTKAYSSRNLLIADEARWEYQGAAHGIANFRVHIFNQHTKSEIGFLELFSDERKAELKDRLRQELMRNLVELNKNIKGNETGELTYYFPQIEQDIQNYSDANWNEIGFFPVVKKERITGFLVASDSYEFSPFAYSSYFTSFIIDQESVAEFLKDEYRSDFIGP